jgi:hypothetical protein
VKDMIQTTQITPVPLHAVYAVWSKVVGYMEEAAASTNGKYTARDIYEGIENGVYVLWIIVENDDIIGALIG